MRIGTLDVDGREQSGAWMSLGFDLDGRDTTSTDSASGSQTCQRIPGSASGVLTDGCGGIDNNFGAHIVKTFKSLCSELEPVANEGLANETLLLRIDASADVDDANVSGALYHAGPHVGPPRFDGSDRWPVVSDSLVDGADVTRPIVTFPDGYVSNGTWVSGPVSSRIDLPFTFCISIVSVEPTAPIGVVTIDLPVDAAILSLNLSAATGTLAGVMGVDALKVALAPVAVKFGFCPGYDTYDQVVTTLTQSADVVLGAPALQDPSRTCDAVSIGLGLTMAPAAPPNEVVAPVPPPPSDCTSPDAGVDSDANGADTNDVGAD